MESLEAASLDLAAAIDSVFKVRAGAYTTSAAAPSRRLPVSRALPRPQVVFVHRYRDTAGAIRVDVLSAFGQWLSADPGTFVHNAYLKYVGWMLSDQLDPDVRVQVRAGSGGGEGRKGLAMADIPVESARPRLRRASRGSTHTRPSSLRAWMSS